MRQCDAELTGSSVTRPCVKVYSHDGPHESFDGWLFFLWSDSMGREMAIAAKPLVIFSEHGEYLRLQGVGQYLKGGKHVLTEPNGVRR